jgi:acyl carrier protein
MEKADALSERIRKFILGQFPLARQRSLRDEDSLLDNGIVDSMGVLELVHFLESEFGITITDEDLSPDNFQTVLQVASLVRAKQSASSTV